MRLLLLTIFILLIASKGNSLNDTLYISLDDCYRLAGERNYSIKIAEKQIGLAEYLRKSAGTQYYGKINFIGRYQYTNNPFQFLDESLFAPVVPFWAIDRDNMDLSDDIMDNPLIHGVVANPVTGDPLLDSDGNPVFFLYSYLPGDQLQLDHNHNFVFGPGISQPIYLGGRINALNEIAKTGVAISQIEKRKVSSDVYFDIYETYWTIVDLQEKELLTEKYLEFLEQLITDLNNLFSEGIILEKDIIKAEVKQNQIKLKKIKIQNGLELARRYLKHLIGLSPDVHIVLTDDISEIPILSNHFSEELAVLHREEIDLLRHGRDLAMSNYKMARARFLPNISLSANYLFMNPNPYRGFKNEFGHDYTIGLNVHIPIFSWGDRVYTKRAAEHLIEIAELKKLEAESLVKIEVQEAWQEYKQSIEQLAIIKRALELAERNLAFYQDRFNEGMITSGDLLNARAESHQAYSDLIEAKTKAKIAAFNFKRKLGVTDFY